MIWCSGVVRHSGHLVFPWRRQDRLDPVQRHWRKNISRSLWGWQNLKPNLTGALFQVDVMTITHYGQPGNLQFQYPIQTPLRLVDLFNLRIKVIDGLLLWNWCFNFPHSFFSILIHHTRDQRLHLNRLPPTHAMPKITVAWVHWAQAGARLNASSE